MRINLLNRALWVTAHCILILLLHPSLTFAEESTDVDPAIFVDATEALRAGEALENNRQWVEAINHYEAVLERFSSFAEFPKFRGLGYLINDKPNALVFGWGERWTTGWHFHIREMCVSVALQGRGYGTRLLHEFELQLFSEGFQNIFLETGKEAPARLFYEKLGYKNLSLVSLSKSSDA